MAEAVIIVLGAGGRVGYELLPLLPAETDVLAISRSPGDVGGRARTRPLALDLTEHGAVAATIAELQRRRIACRIIVVDLVLDRSRVTAMKRSITASARYIAALTEQVRTCGGTCAVLSASTTAALAPAVYQTPYGRAKRDQLMSYARLPCRTVVYLLPQLVTGHDNQSNGISWTYRQAAHELAYGVQLARIDALPRVHLVSPEPVTASLSSTPSLRQALWRVIPTHFAAWSTQRNRPATHRLAAHCRLRLTPAAVRCRVDHHFVPPSRVRQLATELRASLSWTLAQQRQEG